MSANIILSVIIIYFLLLIFISFLTAKKDDNYSFFLANKKSPWYVVAFGMVGASLSGVTFISVPGLVASSQFSYMQMVLGYLLGYFVIAHILLPLYYRLQLTSIYTYLENRFGENTYKTGALFFLISRTIGASFRLFLVASVLQLTIFDTWHIPFFITVSITIFLIWVYTFKGGLNTIIWTDTLQTFFMLTAVITTLIFIAHNMQLDSSKLIETIKSSDYSQIFFLKDWKSPLYFWKQFFAGAFITIVMTGLDQDMMQKNLTCKSKKEAQKNMYWFSFILIPINLIFLSLGALLYLYAQKNGITIPTKADMLYPSLATQEHFPIYIGIIFIIGLIASAYSSADSALTSLTTSFSIDILHIDKKYNPQTQIKKRKQIHILFSFILLIVILIFNTINKESVIKELFIVAGYTYGPLLGLYTFGLFTNYRIKDKLSIFVLLGAILLSYLTKELLLNIFNYSVGFEILILNGFLSFIGLWIISKKPNQ